jgi:hypothetical protein
MKSATVGVVLTMREKINPSRFLLFIEIGGHDVRY